jgi:hypothetical protein
MVKKLVLANAFSINMIQKFPAKVMIGEVSEEWIKSLLRLGARIESYIGHESTAQILSERLGTEIAFNRSTLTLEPGSVVLVAQLGGPRKEYKDMTREEIASYPIRYFFVKVE